YCFSFVDFLLIFTRQQYLFFYIAAYLTIFYLSFFQPQFHKKWQFFLSITLSLFAFFMAERTYHYAYHNSFSKTPFVGTQFLMRPLFLSTSDNYKIFADPQQRQFVQEAMQNIVNKTLIDPDPDKRNLDSFMFIYNTMYHQICAPIWTKI